MHVDDIVNTVPQLPVFIDLSALILARPVRRRYNSVAVAVLRYMQRVDEMAIVSCTEGGGVQRVIAPINLAGYMASHF